MQDLHLCYFAEKRKGNLMAKKIQLHIVFKNKKKTKVG